MRVALGNDHRGVQLKQAIMSALQTDGHTCTDLGTYTDESADYPDFGLQVAEGVSKGDYDSGILICGTGIGMSMVANKVNGIRAALCHTAEEAAITRKHNDANILTLGEQISPEEGVQIARTFLGEKFEGGRHQRRIKKIHDLTGR